MKKLSYILIVLMFIQWNGSRCYAQNDKTEKARPSIVFNACYPLSLSHSQEMLLITPDLNYYFQTQLYGTLKFFHCKITESQYQELLSDIDLSDLKNIQSNDTIVFSKCEGVDDSSYGTIIIKEGEYQLHYIGECTFPSGFDHFYAFLRESRPLLRHKNNNIELTRKSSKIWAAVSEMPALW